MGLTGDPCCCWARVSEDFPGAEDGNGGNESGDLDRMIFVTFIVVDADV